jgi:hypothetical protein
MTTAGATGNATVTMAVADGVSAFMFSLKPRALTSGVIKSQVLTLLMEADLRGVNYYGRILNLVVVIFGTSSSIEIVLVCGD